MPAETTTSEHQDDESSSSPSSPSSPSASSSSFVAHAVTIGDAMLRLQESIELQIQKADDERTPFNQPTKGDGQVRNLFYTLLPTRQQRLVFLRIASSQRSWPRLRSLFGAPPYVFLLPQDQHILNAAGIAARRANLAHEDSKIANYSQFGAGQLEDEHGREYRVMDTSAHENDPLPASTLMDGQENQRVHLLVRIQKKSKQERIRRLKDSALQKTIMFPRPGETIVLQYSKKLLKMQRLQEEHSERTLRVLHVQPRDANASTASIFAVRA